MDAMTDHLFLPEKEELDKLLRYEAMINRQLNHAMGELERVQARRKEKRPRSMSSSTCKTKPRSPLVSTGPPPKGTRRGPEKGGRTKKGGREGKEPGGEVTAISLWENKASSDTYNTNTYPEVLKTMARFIEGTPVVQTGEVVNSTFHKISAVATA